jgi:hypothetical protein
LAVTLKARIVHGAAVVAAFSAFFTWVYWRAVADPVLLAQSDLYEYFLPIFRSPWINWSTFEFSGMPAFADPGESHVYPVHALFAKVLHSWAGFAIAAHVIGAAGMYLYVYSLTRSKSASWLSGLGFGLSEAMIERIAHMSTLHAIAWTPFLFFAVDRVLVTGGRRWIGGGALLTAMVMLSGHPQPLVYACLAAGVYALAGGVAERKPIRYYVDITAMFALGGLIAAIKLLPFAQSLAYMAREEMSYGQFVSQGNTPAQLWSALFPTVLHEGREAPTYVGLLIVIFAVAGAARARAEWRPRFWLGVIVFCVLVTLGSATPVPQLLYDWVPTYDRFRVGSRHLFLACAGLVFLAALGIDAVQRGDRRALAVAIALVAAGMAIGLVYFHGPHAALDFENRYPIAWTNFGIPGWVPNHVWTQVAIALVTIVSCAGFAWSRRRAPWVALMTAVLAFDLLNAQPFAISARGLDSVFIPDSAVEPSVHVRRLRDELAPGRQRFLSFGGTETDPLLPATWARLWRIPIAGGYGPMLLERHSRLSTMGRNGAVRPSTLALADQSLNLLAVKYVGVQPRDVESQGMLQIGGETWEKRELNLPVGKDDCGLRYEKDLSLPLPSGVTAAAVDLIVFIRCSTALPQGTAVGTVTLVGEAGPVLAYTLRAGVDVVEGAAGDPSVAARMQHAQVAGVDDPDRGDQVRTRVTIRLPNPARLQRIDVHAPSFNGWVTVARVTVVDPTGHAMPLSIPAALLEDTRRWRKVRTFSTSRTTDRGRDEDASGESPYTIYENLNAMPRAWVATRMETMSYRDMLATIDYSQTRDGRRFDPATTALFETDAAPQPAVFSGTAHPVRIDAEDNGYCEMQVTADGGGVLVFSETNYPGWRAEVDGRDAPIYTVDSSLMGLVLPPGQHRVVFRFAPRMLWLSALASVAALAVAAVLVVRAISVV